MKQSTFDVPPAISLNLIKHHIGYIRNFIQSGEMEMDKFRRIGNSQMDLYHGDLKPSSIADRIIAQIPDQVMHPEHLHDWLGKDRYQVLEIDDGSTWVVRQVPAARFVHIYPARYSEHSLRVKSHTLKTAIICLMMKNEIDLNTLNEVRKTHLGLGPLKSFQSARGVGKLIKLIGND